MHLREYETLCSVHDRLKPVAKAALNRIELCGMHCFGKSPGRGPIAASGGGAEEAERLGYSRSGGTFRGSYIFGMTVARA